MSSPFYRKSHKAWYIQVGKKQVRLAGNRDEAFRKWHQMMSAGTPENAGATVRQAIDEFLGVSMATSSQRTVDWYKMFLDRIATDRPLSSLKPIDVTRVLAGSKEWGQNTRHNFVRACKRLTRWACQQGLTDADPLAAMPCPPAAAREDYVTPEEMIHIESLIPDGPFKDLVVLAWETGMRPQELFALEGSYLDGGRIVFPSSRSKGGRTRVVYLGSDRAAEIIRRLAAVNRTGPVLRNSEGKPWCRHSVNSAFRRLHKKTGVRTHLGAFRKGYCTQGLKAGIDTVTMASLLGHSNAVMVSRVYAKVYQDAQHMLDAAKKVTSVPSPASVVRVPET